MLLLMYARHVQKYRVTIDKNCFVIPIDLCLQTRKSRGGFLLHFQAKFYILIQNVNFKTFYAFLYPFPVFMNNKNVMESTTIASNLCSYYILGHSLLEIQSMEDDANLVMNFAMATQKFVLISLYSTCLKLYML